MGSGANLENTPTWAVAIVSFCIITISLGLEHLIHLITAWLKKHGKKALIEALEKLKSEMMLLGFISLLLAATQGPISKICISHKVAETMLPCRKITSITETLLAESSSPMDDSTIAPPATYDYCFSKGKVSLISQEGLGQLHIFIFVLAAMHVLYSVLAMALGNAKMRVWKVWEKETQTIEYQVYNDPNRFRYTRETSFGRRHVNTSTGTPFLLWIKCFFRQFFSSLAKVDYMTLRHGFIATHFSTNGSIKFNFQKYIEQSLEEDFKVVVGISPPLWFVVVIFLLVNIRGMHIYLWISVLPLILILALGTKLEVIVAKMAIKLGTENVITRGTPLVHPNDELFWFGHPGFLLHFLHLTLFMNAYEIAFFFWITYEFGLRSCYHDKIGFIILRIVLAVIVQVLCSYITLPLYALVTQMGSHYKKTALEEQTAKLLKEWHEDVRRKQRQKLVKDKDKPISPRNAGPSRFKDGQTDQTEAQAQVSINRL
ncbi:hypothetical protein MKW94_023540 [Papaver nudicaule]|uniref:MLO-like protein n=1 Tax=Papaver nudicaule TaxID=74823 RepID=A0AA42AU01_PAPNU|nr:hypothetical protein [Papaver nudicaule]